MSTVRTAALQHPSASSPAVTLNNAGSADVIAATINSGPLAGFRNAIINGNFDIWQRGTSFTANDYGADRWGHFRVGTTHTATRQAFALGQAEVPGEPTYFCRTVVSSVAGAGNYAALAQRIENVRTFAGQQVTVSFWAKADSTKNITAELEQYFGSGGSPSAVVAPIAANKVSIGTSWQKVTFTANIPSISGKTLGTNGDHVLQLNIWFDAGSNANAVTNSLGQQSGTFDIAQVQIEPGTIATPFERRPLATEIQLCQRYYEKSYDLDVAPGTATDNGLVGGQTYYWINANYAVPAPSVTYRTLKRRTPNLTFWNRSGTANQFSQYYSGTWGNVATAPYVLGNGQAGFLAYPNNYVSSMLFHFAADAEL